MHAAYNWATGNSRPQGAQQNEVAPVGVADPVGAPPPESVHLPGSTSDGVAASLTGSGPVIGLHVPGAFQLPPGGEMHPTTAGDAMVHEPPAGPLHWQGEHARVSATPA